MTQRMEWLIRRAGLGAGALLVVAVAVVPAAAQSGSTANGGPLSLVGALDVPSTYVFRGLVQEDEPQVTVVPSAEVQAALGRARLHVGTWHALLTGSSGLDGPTGRLHYEERLSAGVRVPVGAGLAADATYTAYSSPGAVFESRQELAVRIEPGRWFDTYALVAVELDGAADGADRGAGSYLEVGAAPAARLGPSRARIAVPLRLGVSLKDYYQLFGRDDHRFGFFSVGGVVSWPLGRGGPRGSWDLRGGVEAYLLGDTPKAFNRGNRQALVGHVGVALRY